jgi:hypothetical protein
VAGALEETEFEQILADVGFVGIDIEPTRIYGVDDARTFLGDACCDTELDSFGPQMDGKFMSAFVRGQKPTS